MYINSKSAYCPFKGLNKDENKSGKIFRPWDNEVSSSDGCSQDSTVSTTTQDEELNGGKAIEASCSSQKCQQEKLIVNSPKQEILVNLCDSYVPSTSLEYLSDPYGQLSADLVQTNLAQHLGLPENDPLLLESLARGYALEEYARVVNQEQQAKLLASKKQRPKKYKCPHCDVGFSNNGQLKGHIRIHTGERPFKCDEKDCNKTFTRNEELTRHKRIHSGLRPFPCSHCGKKFGRKDHLKKHSRTHFQPRGLYAVPVVLPYEAWASGQTNGYPFFPLMY